jgi:DNA topoisomerase-1
MKLVIVESPSKSKTISKYLGDDFVVRASVGHVRDLPKSSKKAVDIEGGFVPHYESRRQKRGGHRRHRRAGRQGRRDHLATDPDREGEAIAWHIAEVLKERLGSASKEMERITFHEITKEAVEEAMQHPRQIDEHLREAQEARRVLDRIVGYDLSGLIWKKVRYGLSAGRVQSPALRIIMEREREIRAFKPETYWVIAGEWNTPKKAAASPSPAPRSRATRKKSTPSRDRPRKEKWQVTDVEESEQKRSPRAPFITSTLQQAASTRSASRLRAPWASPRSSTKPVTSPICAPTRPTSASRPRSDRATVVKKITASNISLPQVRRQEQECPGSPRSHPSVRLRKESAGHNDEQKKLYRLIWQRAVASQMSDAVMARTKIIRKYHRRKQARKKRRSPPSRLRGHRLARPLRRLAQGRSGIRRRRGHLPKVRKRRGARPRLHRFRREADPAASALHRSRPHQGAREARHRPSVHVRFYLQDHRGPRLRRASENKSLKPTDTGDVVSSFLEEYFPSYISDSFTADMEDKLDEIANGERTNI